jgi:alpha-L-fucosidase
VAYTQSKDNQYVYVILKEWPGLELPLKGISVSDDSKIEMLGYDKPLEWIKSDEGISVKIPTQMQDEKNRPCEHAWIVKIKMGTHY